MKHGGGSKIHAGEDANVFPGGERMKNGEGGRSGPSESAAKGGGNRKDG